MFGKFIGESNFELFGYFAYIVVLFLFFILYLFYFNKFDYKISLKVLGILILFFSLLFLQSLIINKGVIGNLFINTLKGYIGIFGVIIFTIVIGLWGIFLIFEDSILTKIKSILNSKKTSHENSHVSSNEHLKEEIYEDNNEDNIVLENTKIEQEEFPLLDESKKIKLEKELNKTTKEKKVKLEEDKKVEEDKKDIKVNEEKKVAHVEELEDTKKLLSQIEIGEREKPKDWKFPPINYLQKPPKKKKEINEADIDKKIKVLLEKLKQFKIEGDVVRYYIGPVVTTFEFKPLPHIKVSKILALQDDLAMALKAKSIRIQAPIPGKDVVGIEIPNEKMETIYLREILESDIFNKSKSPLTLALGKDIVGVPFVTDLKKLPHLLIAGTTGSGKSVGINAMILSLLYRNSPDELKFVMIDPKMLEFSIYNDIPHLLTPVITEPKKAITALNAMVKEMERRYKLMAKMRVKNIEGYNQKVKKEEKLPYIVIIIDELADLMMTSGKDVEYSIARLAQMARASGIHLIVATQRPSVDVVTGLIKANLPSRISFKVGQKIDSKVILDQFGAESLLGRGDMLFTPPGITGLLRLHAPFTTEEEIEKVVEFLKSQREPSYDNSFINTIESETEMLENIDDVDELFEEAKEIILKERRTSISYLQRRLQIGYNRAANIIEQMERAGILSPPNSKGQREILI
ncbi:DNA translocase FtsK [Caminibacter mediatlanticus TB-2]|uniref:Cell divisionFtsK/SpoIIIE n=1 Tax=Caminibacter mediatlanticus TB-2 TaxID=391592 RepID=A0AAI9AI80_9BACT|nr:DNA translocase FtsK [Caminibacter mediatlanticus]EDM23977.1 Cell divisionFtsK/SpoIIIE [Caminibacter mediatlanticus TB-2]QCT94340.1 DNA translocase FtsK [Caminibacter mediatlanticus TB-2]